MTSAQSGSASLVIHRSMEEEGGMPRLGATATRLGIRKGKDIIVDANDQVHRPQFQPGQPNGLSCAPEWKFLPLFVMPMGFGGPNKRTEVWYIDIEDLGSELVAAEDGRPGQNRHVSIGPSRTIQFAEFVAHIEATRPYWRKLSGASSAGV